MGAESRPPGSTPRAVELAAFEVHTNLVEPGLCTTTRFTANVEMLAT
ncbi:hypothetical protein ACIBM3_33790 [Rhodococcus erythropolis]